MKKLIRKILREEINKSDRHYRMLDKISNHVQLPYFESMEGLTIYDEDDQLYIMKKILYHQAYPHTLYIDSYTTYSDGWEKRVYSENSNSGGYWEVYREDSSGYWEERVVDDYGTEIYHENSRGYIYDRR
jgi:hypothetical protein